MSADLYLYVLEGISELDVPVTDSRKLDAVPNCWIGSWSMFSDSPETVIVVEQLIRQYFPILDDVLAKKIIEAFALKNTTNHPLENIGKVTQFLQIHKGKKVFVRSE